MGINGHLNISSERRGHQAKRRLWKPDICRLSPGPGGYVFVFEASVDGVETCFLRNQLPVPALAPNP